ncbi:glycosyltransferase, partial [Nanoarchaeota archaeon]
FMDLDLNQVNGVVRYYSEMIKYLIKNPQHEVLFITSGKKDYKKKISPNVTNFSVNCRGFNIPQYKEYPFFCFRKPHRKVLKEIKEFKPDLIHSVTPIIYRGLGKLGIQIGNELGIPVIGIYHSHIIKFTSVYIKDFLTSKKFQFFSPLYYFIGLINYIYYKNKNLNFYPEELNNLNLSGFKKILYLGFYYGSQALVLKYKKCKYIMVPHDDVIDYLSRITKRDKIKRFSHGVDKQRFNRKWRSKELRKKLGLEKKKALLYVGRVSLEKSIDEVIKYYLREKIKRKVALVIVGDGPYKQVLQKKYPEIIFTGYLRGKKLSEIYASCDEFIFFSKTETFGLVYLEALASGLSVYPKINMKKFEPINWNTAFQRLFRDSTKLL